jgi:hypothetical protein
LNRVQIERIWPTDLQATIPVTDWKVAHDAVETFAEPSLIAARDKSKQKAEEAHLKSFDAEDAIRDIKKKFAGSLVPDDAPEARTLATKQMILQHYKRGIDWSTDELRGTWDELRSDIHKKLVSGALVAKGFRVPHVAGTAEVEITSSEWRILVLDSAEARALRKDDNEVVYSGLMIGQRPKP